MIDVRRLSVLRMLDEHGSVTGAAQALYLTPSAVSQQIRQLGQDLGIELLERRGRGVRLTPAARTLVAHADTFHAQWERLLADLAETQADDDGTPVRMCGFPTALASLLAPAAARLRETHPRLQIEMTEAESSSCFGLLLADRADLAVVVP